MDINYYITEPAKNVFSVVINDTFNRTMVFCRTQEYYESPNPQFRGKPFSIFDYIDWYAREHDGVFTYTGDWDGFNVPYEVAFRCFCYMTPETPYDKVMSEILKEITLKKDHDLPAYILGVPEDSGDTFHHEVCHGLYYTNSEYKKSMDEITNSIDIKYLETFRDNLIEMGYIDEVVNDEVQAYLNTNWDNKSFGKGIPKKIKESLHKRYVNSLKAFHKFG